MPIARDVRLNIADRHPARVEADEHLVQAADPAGVLGHQAKLEAAGTVSRPGVDWGNMVQTTIGYRHRTWLRRACALALASAFALSGAAGGANAAPSAEGDEILITYTNYSTIEEI